MQSREIYFIGLGAVQLLIFFRLLELARQLTTVTIQIRQNPLSLLPTLLVGLSIFLIFHNLTQLIQLISAPKEQVVVQATLIARGTAALLSLILISTLVQGLSYTL